MITDAEFSIIHGLWTPLSWIYLSLSIYQKAQISNDAFHQKPLETSQGLLTQTICFMFSWITQPWMRRMALLIAFVNFFVHTVKRASSCISLHCFLTRGDIKTHILYIWHSTNVTFKPVNFDMWTSKLWNILPNMGWEGCIFHQKLLPSCEILLSLSSK